MILAVEPYNYVIVGSFTVNLFIDFGFLYELRTGWLGAPGTFMIRRPIKKGRFRE